MSGNPGPSSTGDGGSGGRLPSFKAPRDLTLSSSSISQATVAPSTSNYRSKRVFKPNIPPKRDRNLRASQEPSQDPSKESSSSAGAGSQHPPRAIVTGTGQQIVARGGGGQGFRGRGRGRGRGQSNLIQSTSLFAEGIGDPTAIRASVRPTARNSSVRARPSSTITRESLRNIVKEKGAAGQTFGDDEEGVDFNELFDYEEEEKWCEEDVAVTLPLGQYAACSAEPTPPHLTLTQPQIILFQFPSSLPVLKEEGSNEFAKSIGALPEGYIGKIQITASGKTRFVLGENSFDISTGEGSGFRQDLTSIDLENGTLTELGQVFSKLVVTPDISALFKDIL